MCKMSVVYVGETKIEVRGGRVELLVGAHPTPLSAHEAASLGCALLAASVEAEKEREENKDLPA